MNKNHIKGDPPRGFMKTYFIVLSLLLFMHENELTPPHPSMKLFFHETDFLLLITFL